MKMKFLLIPLMLTSTILVAQNTSRVSFANEDTGVISGLKLGEEGESDSSWTIGGNLGLNFSQVYLTNWAAGGQSSLSSTAIVNLFGNYAKEKISWDNTLDIAYGMLKQGDAVFIKTDDKLDFSSKFGYKTNSLWFYAVLLNFRTQFSAGYNDPLAPDSVRKLISDVLAPAYGLMSLGMDYKPSDNFTFLIAPVTAKLTIVGDQGLADAGAFGVDAAEFDDLGDKISDGANSRIELGAYLKMMYKTEVVENVSLQTKLDLFSNYQNNPGNIDVNWEVLVTMKINGYLSTTIATQLLYDDDVNVTREDGTLGPDTQFKEVLSIGISYKFKSLRTRKRIKRGFALLTVGAVLMISSFFFYKHLIRPGQIKSDHFSSDYYNDCVTNNLEQDFPEGCVVFFGNSLMAEFPLEMVQSDYKLVKYAVRGAFSEELLRRKSLLDFHPEKIILLLGINDILVGFDHEDVVGNIEQFIQLAQKANTDIAIISLLPVSFRDGVFAKRDHVNSEVFFCNLALKNLADDEGCGFIELHSKFCDSDGTLKADLTYDGVHLTTKGHLLWADAFSNFLTE